MAEYKLTVENTQSYMQPLREELQAFWQSAIDRSFGAANQVRIQWQAMSRQDRAEFLQMHLTTIPDRNPRPDSSVLFLLPEINVEDLTTGDNLLDLLDSRLGNTAWAHAQDRTLLAAWHKRNGKQEVELLMASLEREVFLLNVITCVLGPMTDGIHALRNNMLAGRSPEELDKRLIAQLKAGDGGQTTGPEFKESKRWRRLHNLTMEMYDAWGGAKKASKKLHWSDTTRRPDLVHELDGPNPSSRRRSRTAFHAASASSGAGFISSSESGTSTATVFMFTVLLGAMAVLWLRQRKPGREAPGAGPEDRQPQRRRGGGNQQQRQRDNRRRNNANRRHQGTQEKQPQPPPPPPPPPPKPYLGKPDATEPKWWEALEDYHVILQNEAQPAFTCSITSEIMRNPWTLRETTNNFEASAIYKWVVEQGKTHDPQTRQELTSNEMFPNDSLRRDIRSWCEERAAALRKQNDALQPAPVEDHSAPQQQQLYVFVDDSNLVLGSKGKAVHLGKLVAQIHGARRSEKRVVVGSGHKPSHWARWRELRYTVHADPRTGPEVFVDEALMSQIAYTAVQEHRPPRVLAVVTGDGNANGGRATFPDHIQTALVHGWLVEVYAWKGGVHHTYTRFAEAYPKQFKLILLDGLDLT